MNSTSNFTFVLYALFEQTHFQKLITEKRINFLAIEQMRQMLKKS